MAYRRVPSVKPSRRQPKPVVVKLLEEAMKPKPQAKQSLAGMINAGMKSTKEALANYSAVLSKGKAAAKLGESQAHLRIGSSLDRIKNEP